MTAPDFDRCFPHDVDALVASAKNYAATVGARRGVMLHYDASSSDASGLGWLHSPAFKLSYHRAYLDNGRVARITPQMSGVRAYHAGVCRQTPDIRSANDAFYAFALIANDGDTATDAQFTRVAVDVAAVGAWHHAYNPDPAVREWWRPDAVETWIVGHNEWAIFNQRDNPTAPKLWGKLGRKTDPIGTKATPVLSLVQLRAHVQTYLETIGSEPLAMVGL